MTESPLRAGSRNRASAAPNTPASSLIQRRNLGSDVYHILWDRILDRELHPGEKLSDLRLSEELGVSRTPVREALHRLVQDGVVIAEPNRGFFVASYDRADIEEIYALRAALESFALRNAVDTVSPDQFKWALAELERVEYLLRTAEKDDERTEATAAFLEVDRGFHNLLLESSHNRRLIAILNGLWAQIAVFQKAGLMITGWIDNALDEHRIILNHLIDGETDAAARALEHHIDSIRDRVLADFALNADDAGASENGVRAGKEDA
ncbi:MAG TPA: GntR family transcriptional regulator [Thermomicrobiales bacterium]|nr:GntR family transcriptional regulator [Thermomicrobiales bacterium]